MAGLTRQSLRELLLAAAAQSPIARDALPALDACELDEFGVGSTPADIIAATLEIERSFGGPSEGTNALIDGLVALDEAPIAITAFHDAQDWFAVYMSVERERLAGCRRIPRAHASAPRPEPRDGITINGRTSFLLRSDPWQTAAAPLLERLGRLNGSSVYSLILWRLPEGVSFDGLDMRTFPAAYMQCAGDFMGQLTCEIRDAEGHQYTLGRPRGGRGLTATDRVITWNDFRTLVRENEVLSGAEVGELMLAYRQTGEPPATYERRLLDLKGSPDVPSTPS
jgi:hypothetical protein